MDVGVSSPQLDRPERGFSFTAQGPLDMRMNPEEGSSAAEWLNQADEAEIAQVLWMYGEERQSRRIARAIVAARPLTTTLELADLVAQAVPRPRGPQRKHPATRTFQAVRIFVNEEAQELDQGLQQGFSSLAVGGRLAVISFHSLEDRKVKHAFRQLSQPPKMPRRLPVRNLDQEVQGRLIGGPMKPSLAELNANPRSRSATLRVIEKVR
jgi:16S rRNA (cytosine1402-N4)-methyltransferase